MPPSPLPPCHKRTSIRCLSACACAYEKERTAAMQHIDSHCSNLFSRAQGFCLQDTMLALYESGRRQHEKVHTNRLYSLKTFLPGVEPHSMWISMGISTPDLRHNVMEHDTPSVCLRSEAPEVVVPEEHKPVLALLDEGCPA